MRVLNLTASVKKIHNLMWFIFLFMLLYLSTYLPKKIRNIWYEPLYRFLCRMLIQLLDIHIHTHHRERIYSFSQTIYISNHPSKIELFLLPILIPSLDGLIEKESLSIPFLGRILAKTNSIFIDRKSFASRRGGAQLLVKKLQNAKSVIIFPEGKPSVYMSKKFYKGAFYLSKKCNLPIIPIYIDYSDRIAFKVEKKISNLQVICNILKAKNKSVSIYFFAPVMPNQYENISVYANDLHNQYINWQNQIT